jgi:hypothetical protein
MKKLFEKFVPRAGIKLSQANLPFYLELTYLDAET